MASKLIVLLPILFLSITFIHIFQPAKYNLMVKTVLILMALASVTMAYAGDLSPAEYVKAKYGKHDLALASKNPRFLDSHEIAFLLELGMRWDPVEKCWWGPTQELHSKDWRHDAILITARCPRR
jgi:hypothetical protein